MSSSGPSFENPPAIERVLSVQFRELAGFDVIHYGLWYEKIRKEFPFAAQQGRLPPMEDFTVGPFRRAMKLEIELGKTLNRCVYASTKSDPTRIQQLQPDRLAMNWRRRPGDEYKSFEDTSARFAETFQSFSRFCSTNSLSMPSIELCEVVYVNRIEVLEGLSPLETFRKVFGEGTIGLVEPWGAPSGITLNRRYDFPDERGRLYAEATLARDAEGEFVQLKMTGRTGVNESDSWQDRLRLAHDWVVNGFAAITSREVRETIWRQTR